MGMTRARITSFQTYRSVNGRRANRGHDPSGPTADRTGVVERHRKKNGSRRTTREKSRERAMVEDGCSFGGEKAMLEQEVESKSVASDSGRARRFFSRRTGN